jgi:hypothetical protein
MTAARRVWGGGGALAALACVGVQQRSLLWRAWAFTMARSCQQTAPLWRVYARRAGHASSLCVPASIRPALLWLLRSGCAKHAPRQP